ncbi:MAG: choice-of-anchor J domain-containing protein [Prevotella sp.]|nr:choice-of-anchor J domain-containing protein [Prevotella sp.]
MKPKSTSKRLLLAAFAILTTSSTALPANGDGDAIIPPFEENWAVLEAFEQYTVVDANGDDRTWGMDSNGLVRYSYSTRNDADDWLLSPDILLEPGRVYQLSLTATAGKSYSERMEVKLGEGDSHANYTTMLMEPADIAGGDTVEWHASFSVQERKTFRVGFHAISPKNHFYLTLTQWKLTVMVESGAPSQVEGLTVTPGAKGALTAEVSFTAPSTTMGGEPLESIDKIEVKSSGQVLKTILHPTPGAEQHMETTVETDGIHVFEVVVANAVGESLPLTAKAYIGRDAPVMQGSVNCQDLRGGRMVCSWKAVDSEEGANGGYVNPEDVEYRVYVLDSKGRRDELVGTTREARCEFDYSYWDWGYAETLSVEVEPRFAQKAGEPRHSQLIIGNPATLPYTHSFAKASGDGYWWEEEEVNARWDNTSLSADNDKGSTMFVALDNHATAKAGTQKIELKGAQHPMLIFQYLIHPGGGLKVKVMASRQDAEEPTCLQTMMPDDATDGSWVLEAIDLNTFAEDDYVVLYYEVEAEKAAASVCLDDICVRDVPDCDIELLALSLPKSVKVGEQATITATVRNNGLNTVKTGSCAVAFIINGKEVGLASIESDMSPFKGEGTCSLDFVPTIFFGTQLELTAKVVCREDETSENNTATATATVRQPSVTRPTNLTAWVQASDVHLQWEMPEDPSDFGFVITEEFEDAEVFPPMSLGGVTDENHQGALGQWKLHDYNGGPTYAPEGCDTCENMGAPMAFMVFNAHHAGLDMTDHHVVETMAAYSGEQALIAMCPLLGEASDKWLISPHLSETEQTISFFVSATEDNDGEVAYEVLYSTTDDKPEHFLKAYEGTANSTDWREVRIDLPTGVTYFALRSISQGKAGLMMDDITFTAYPTMARMPAAKVMVTAYNVYRDEELVATMDAGTMEHTDTNVPDGQHRYHVTAMYGTTESALSHPASVVVNATDIPLPSTDTLSTTDIVVYSTNGVMLGRGEDTLRRLPAGLYIIKDQRRGCAATLWRK